MRFWNFVQGTTAGTTEIRLSGDFIDDEDAWINEWFGIPCASPNAFRQELDRCKDQEITVTIDSYGGSVFAAVGIYNALMDFRAKGGKVTCKTDSKCMSAATIPFMAGNKKCVSLGSVFMMHPPLTEITGYAYAKDLRKAADVLDVIEESIINAYEKGTGLDRKSICKLMDDETYWSANEVVEHGFADEVFDPLDGCKTKDGCGGKKKDEVMDFAMSRMKVVASAKHGMDGYFRVLDKIKEEEKENMDIKNMEDLKKAYPELFKGIQDAAINAERSRITALETLDDVSNAMVHDIIADAKATGKSVEDIQLYVDMAKKNAPVQADTVEDAKKEIPGTDYMRTVVSGNKGSGVDNVAVSGIATEVDDAAKDAASAKMLADAINAINKNKGGTR